MGGRGADEGGRGFITCISFWCCCQGRRAGWKWCPGSDLTNLPRSISYRLIKSMWSTHLNSTTWESLFIRPVSYGVVLFTPSPYLPHLEIKRWSSAHKLSDGNWNATRCRKYILINIYSRARSTLSWLDSELVFCIMNLCSTITPPRPQACSLAHSLSLSQTHTHSFRTPFFHLEGHFSVHQVNLRLAMLLVMKLNLSLVSKAEQTLKPNKCFDRDDSFLILKDIWNVCPRECLFQWSISVFIVAN